MFGWTNGTLQDQTPMELSLEVLPPPDCGNDSNFTHCSFVTEANRAAVCAYRLGAPLVCIGTAIAGYMVSDGCETRSGATIVRFNSAADAYGEWMQVIETMTTPTTPRTTTMMTTTTTGGAESIKSLFLGVVFGILTLLMNL
jgi:hypothetical protein